MAAALQIFERAGKPCPGLHVCCLNRVPLGSGMGSSSAAMLTGMLGANALLGNPLTDEQILTAIERGHTIAGGACAFFGACGAAIGAGIAVSVLTGATPLDGEKRRFIQQVTQSVLGDIAAYSAPRCC